MASWPSKDPNDIENYSVDWSRRLGSGETLTSADFSLTTAAGLTIASSSFDDTTATVWLTNGDDGGTGVILCRVNTSASRQLDQSVSLPIVSR